MAGYVSLQDLKARFKGKVPMAQHGTGMSSLVWLLYLKCADSTTDENPDELFRECIRNGISKVSPFLQLGHHRDTW